jgi:hypothetical protein
MTENTAFLMKDLVLLAVSFYLLRQDVLRVSVGAKAPAQAATARLHQNASPLAR